MPGKKAPTQMDARGLAVTCHSSAPLEGYEKALKQSLAYVGDPIETMRGTLENNPEFLLGHIFIASLALMMTQRSELSLADQHLQAAQALIHHGNDREKRLLAAARQMREGRWGEASRTWDLLLTEYPRDALAIQLGHLTDFYCGDSLNLRDRIARAIGHWDGDVPGYSYVRGMFAFGLEECNEFDKAEAFAREALEIERRDCWTIHALGHVCEMQGRYEEGIKMYRERIADWTPDNSFRYHNWWHLGLYYMEQEDFAGALQLYDDEILPQPCDISLQLCDASALLWRLELQGLELAERWERLAGMWAGTLNCEQGYYAFNDLHAMMAFVRAGRADNSRELLATVRAVAGGDHGTNSMMSAEAGLPACEAIIAFSEARYDDAIEKLMRVRPLASRFGGSNAQRDVLTQTLLESALRAGRNSLARSILNERKTHKANTPLSRRFKRKLAS